MVHIHDEGSVFDAPLEAVWKYLGTSQEHAGAHTEFRNGRREQVRDGVIKLSREEQVDGKWVKTVVQISLFPPLGYAQEFLEGPLAGSRAFQFYTPKGNRTGITVVGEFVMAGKTPSEVEAHVMGQLARVFEDDRTGLRSFLGHA